MAAAATCTLAVAFWPEAAYSHNPITTTVLFNREVSKIFQQKCLQCHAAGGLAMSLATYEEARPWAIAIKEEILSRRMPPWPAERGYGDFANDVGLTERERAFLIAWVDGGAPKGDVEPPAFLDHSTHWMLGNPDAVLTATPGVTIARGQLLGLNRIVLTTGFPQDRWLRGFDYKPDRRVVRAAFLTVVETGQYLGTWTPWRTSIELPEGAGSRIPARSRIAVDVLYQPAVDGLLQSAPDRVVDTPQLGLYFTAGRPAREMTTTVLEPAAVAAAASGAARSRVTATLQVPNDMSIVEIWPDMDAGARSIEVKTKRPDGSSQVLLWIKKFREEWRTSYAFRQPLTLPRGSIVQAIAYFDGAASRQTPPRFKITFSGYEPGGGTAPATDGPPRPASPRSR